MFFLTFDVGVGPYRAKVHGMKEPYYHTKIREIAATIALTHGNVAIRAPIMGEVIDTRKRSALIRLALVLRRHPSKGLLASVAKPRLIDVRRAADDWLYAGVIDQIEVVFEIVCTEADFEQTKNIFKTQNLLIGRMVNAP